MNSVANVSETVDHVFLIITGTSIVLLLGIIGFMAYYLWRYHHKRNPRATPIDGSVKLEIIWTVLPIFLTLFLFWVGYEGFLTIRDFPDDAMQVKVTGRMWAWTFEYENGKQTDTLYVPVNQPVIVEITSQDVNHSFYIPAFRIKADAINGHVNKLWFEATQAGSYDVACAEYCGLSHAYMYTKVVALPPAEYAQWYAIDEE